MATNKSSCSSFLYISPLLTTITFLISFFPITLCNGSVPNFDLSSLSLEPAKVGYMLKGISATGEFGFVVKAAGDINKDGYDDIIIGAPREAGGKGAVYVVYGDASTSFLSTDLSSTPLDPATTGFTIIGDAVGGNFGESISWAGDVNNDGYDDIIIGATSRDTEHGAAYVIYGGEKSSLPNRDLSSMPLTAGATGFMITGNAAGDQFGWSVSTAGDLNNDDFDDIVVGAPVKNGAQGIAYVIYGGPKSSLPNIDLTP